MKILIKQAKIIDPSSSHNGKTMDILVHNGTIQEIRKSIKADGTKVVSSQDLHVSPGWVDIGTQIGEPGYEHRETLSSASSAAMAGGYTAIAVFPNTDPAIHSKSEVSFILKTARSLPIDIFPIGAVSRNCEGRDIAEILDMRQNGAVAFSDGAHPLTDSGLLLRALLYVKKFDGLIIHTPYDPNLAPEGQMHEGTVSTTLGLKGLPSLAEYLMVRRDIKIQEYTESRLHLHAISTREATAQLREARKAGLDVTSSCPAVNLLLEDGELEEFDSRYKVLPPLRSANDRRALIQAFKDGVIDMICSNHVPRDVEEKHREFSQSAFGSTGLETAFSSAWTALKEHVGIERLVDALAIRPRELLGLRKPSVRQGEEADMTLFDPTMEWEVTEGDLNSLSKNEALIGYQLTGKALGVIKKGRLNIERHG